MCTKPCTRTLLGRHSTAPCWKQRDVRPVQRRHHGVLHTAGWGSRPATQRKPVLWDLCETTDSQVHLQYDSLYILFKKKQDVSVRRDVRGRPGWGGGLLGLELVFMRVIARCGHFVKTQSRTLASSFWTLPNVTSTSIQVFLKKQLKRKQADLVFRHSLS